MCTYSKCSLYAKCSLAIVLAIGSAAAEGVRAHATRRAGAISIDGRLDEQSWQDAPVQTGFTQRFPKDGGPASFATRFAIVYDNDAMYVGVWADDPEPAQIRALLTRRDVDAPADFVAIGFDSYHDRRTAFVFQLNAAGVQRDLLVFDDVSQDDTWDAVWTGDVAITPAGWTAEFRIPLNQLRFASGETHEWGFQVLRVVARTQEQTTWSPSPRSANQIASKFGVVDGIDHVTPGRRLELLPYVTGGFDSMPVEAGDPLNQRYGGRGNVGLDLKYGLGPAFTLSATINPDFGQVEADPSEVNLSANELFFAEKRPFFTEGVDLFKLPIGTSDETVEGAFYTRRIGAAPPSPDADYQYVKAPRATAIYGAAKLTGKTSEGWSVGLLDAVTGRETAEIIDASDARASTYVATLTNFGVARVKRDFNDAKTSLGGAATAVNRAVGGTPLIASLHDQAYTGYLELQHRWDNNAWEATLRALGSYVHGSPDAIALTQRSSRHYFQRPDLEGAHFDPARTDLAGLGLNWSVGRWGDVKHWRFGSGGDVRTIGLELNDAGFQTGSNRLATFLWTQWREDDPGDRILNWQVNTDVFMNTTLEPRLTDLGIECNGSVQLVSYWTLSAGCNIDRARWSVTALRGGQALRSDPHATGWANVTTDNRKRLWLSLNVDGGWNWTSKSYAIGAQLGATIQARSNIDIFLGPSWGLRDEAQQYVDTIDAMHVVFARIKQTTVDMTVRINWTFSPHLTLQAYAQPYVSSGAYSAYRDVDDPHALRYADRFTPITLTTYPIARPDFDFRQLRSTMVVRWEYRPGSTLFAIWSHGRTSEIDDGRFDLGRDLRDLGRAASENVVMVKANYWIGL